MKSALGFGSLRIHKSKPSNVNASGSKDGLPASPSSPVVQVQHGQKPTVDAPAQRIRIDVGNFGVPEDATPEADQWCKAAQKADIHALASLIERAVLADQELDTVRIGLLQTGCPTN
jgi:hypothetical protein